MYIDAILVNILLIAKCCEISSALTAYMFFSENDFNTIPIKASDARVEISTDDGITVIHVNTGYAVQWPGITLTAPKGKWDLSDYKYLSLDLKNVGDNRVSIHCRVDNPGADGIKNCITRQIALDPGSEGTLKIPLPRALPIAIGSKLFAMRGYPGGLLKESPIDISSINQLVIFVSAPKSDHAFEIKNIKAEILYTLPEWINMDESQFFPLIDEYGQFIHKDWVGKIKTGDDLEKHKRDEEANLKRNTGPDDWDIYGGWKNGPNLTATGHFRAEKYNGKWWLVDPDGHLFWSHGIDCVGSGNGVTPITDRQHWFKLPDRSSEFGIFYGKGSWAPHNYYEDKGTYETYNFTASNLLRKYGESWQKDFAEITHTRLRSWGMNTIANWSDNHIYLMRKTPYVVSIGFGGRWLEGSEGYWGKFRDVFDSSFETELRKSMLSQKGRSAGDPWCIGYFVDNEISWGDETSLAIATLVSPPDQPAKKAFIDDLKAKYTSIDNLNKAWGTDYESWDAMLQSRQSPNKEKAYNDLTAFYSRFAERYFRICRDAVKEVAPDNLYLGCRFAWTNDLAAKAAEKYCDVISYNLYQREVGGFRLPAGIDKPVIIGEFHFGALDRGMFHTGLQETEDQEDRARTYKNYVTGALKNPQIVGTHWFQYGDQATTGRGDGENYQIGFLDVVDTPYAETIKACREVGYSMYDLRDRVK